MIPFQEIDRLVGNLTPEIINFLQQLIAIPSPSGNERAVIERVGNEMAALKFDRVWTDGMGNLIGVLGSGTHILAIDGHADTVAAGNLENWSVEPYRGTLRDGIIYGRGACDMKGALAAMVYAGGVIKKIGLEDDFTLYITVTVQEEDCEGLCWDYIINQDKIIPHLVVLGETTNLQISRGQRGRVEIKVETTGRSCHSSTPESGHNAIYRIAPLVQEIAELNHRLPMDPFLGKGSIAITRIDSSSPSPNAVPDLASICIDRRIIPGESVHSVCQQIEHLESFKSARARIQVPDYDQPSYTGYRQKMPKFFPSWVLDREHPLLRIAQELCQDLFNYCPQIIRWDFSTNGVSTAGAYRIPTIGFGPGEERYAHTVDDQCPVGQLTSAAKFYAAFPIQYVQKIAGKV
jgi:putative selenium metabolism hydrolase